MQQEQCSSLVISNLYRQCNTSYLISDQLAEAFDHQSTNKATNVKEERALGDADLQ